MRRFLLPFTLFVTAPVLAQDGSSPPYPPPGRLVDIGGWRLHLHCTGNAPSGQPIVILEAGVGDFSVEWSLVQPKVAAFARVCSYDRAGTGWSDMGPLPRSMRQIVHELHTLLEKAGESAPFVIVGHSYGGVLVRLYQSTYPDQVAGLMLIDAGRLDPQRNIDGRTFSILEIARGSPVPAVKTSSPLRDADIPPSARVQITAAAQMAAGHANEPPRDRLPVEAQRMRTWTLGQVKHYTGYGPGALQLEAEELALMVAELRKNPVPLGDTPLIVLTAGKAEYGADQQALEDDRRRSQASLAALSRNGKQVVSGRSGHHVQLEDPELVVQSLKDLLSVVRR